ncbi:unnamed protein product [Lasius platythorax]|uniref:Uncharacterized protein n=1 Tax=Lasius platythorax TaxID=488582 RepID=A0AAV2MXU8_9HYME
MLIVFQRIPSIVSKLADLWFISWSSTSKAKRLNLLSLESIDLAMIDLTIPHARFNGFMEGIKDYCINPLKSVMKWGIDLFDHILSKYQKH